MSDAKRRDGWEYVTIWNVLPPEVKGFILGFALGFLLACVLWEVAGR